VRCWITEECGGHGVFVEVTHKVFEKCFDILEEVILWVRAD